jgi:hypothetical protein
MKNTAVVAWPARRELSPKLSEYQQDQYAAATTVKLPGYASYAFSGEAIMSAFAFVRVIGKRIEPVQVVADKMTLFS